MNEETKIDRKRMVELLNRRGRSRRRYAENPRLNGEFPNQESRKIGIGTEANSRFFPLFLLS